MEDGLLCISRLKGYLSKTLRRENRELKFQNDELNLNNLFRKP